MSQIILEGKGSVGQTIFDVVSYTFFCYNFGPQISVLEKCHFTVKLPGNSSLNVAVTGSIVLHDRVAKNPIELPANHKG